MDLPKRSVKSIWQEDLYETLEQVNRIWKVRFNFSKSGFLVRISFTDFNKNLLGLLHQATSSLGEDFLHGSPRNFEFHSLGLLQGMHLYLHKNPLLQTMSLTELQLQSRSIHLLILPRDFPLDKRCAIHALRSGSGAFC